LNDAAGPRSRSRRPCQTATPTAAPAEPVERNLVAELFELVEQAGGTVLILHRPL